MESNNKDILNWAILCPGPSLAKHSELVHDTGCLIAVNGAILKTKAPWWAMCDEEVFVSVWSKGIIGELLNDTTLWIPSTWLNFAHKRLPPIFKDFKRETWGNLSLEMNIGVGFPWREYTMFTAIALAIKKGAKHIRIYGADFGGSGYFEPGLENKRTRHVDKRWEDEKFWFCGIVTVAAQNDIDIQRIESC